MSHANTIELRDNQGWDPRILVCHNGDLVDLFVVVTERYVIIIDTAINEATALALLALARPHLDGTRMLLVINTHADYDHAWGNQLFSGPDAIQPAPIIGTRLCEDRLRSADWAETLRQMQTHEPDIFGGVRLTTPTVLFDQQLTIDGGDLTLELFAAPGHTPDHIAIYIPEIDTLLAADGAELPYPQARTPDALPQMRQSLVRMAALDAATVLYCHAPVTLGPQLLHDNIAYFDGLEVACRAALVLGVSAESLTDAELIARIGCRYEDATPASDLWQAVHPYYKNQGHAQQLRAMLGALAA